MLYVSNMENGKYVVTNSEDNSVAQYTKDELMNLHKFVAGVEYKNNDIKVKIHTFDSANMYYIKGRIASMLLLNAGSKRKFAKVYFDLAPSGILVSDVLSYRDIAFVPDCNNVPFRVTSMCSTAIIDKGIEWIPEKAFYLCAAMEELQIPDSVTQIGVDAFQCCKEIKDVYYQGTAEQWQKIKIEKGNQDFFDQATMHYNSEKYFVPEKMR